MNRAKRRLKKSCFKIQNVVNVATKDKKVDQMFIVLEEKIVLKNEQNFAIIDERANQKQINIDIRKEVKDRMKC